MYLVESTLHIKSSLNTKQILQSVFTIYYKVNSPTYYMRAYIVYKAHNEAIRARLGSFFLYKLPTTTYLLSHK